MQAIVKLIVWEYVVIWVWFAKSKFYGPIFNIKFMSNYNFLWNIKTENCNSWSVTVTNFSDINSGFKNITFPRLPASNNQGQGEFIGIVSDPTSLCGPSYWHVLPLRVPREAPAGARAQTPGPRHRLRRLQGAEGPGRGASHAQGTLLQSVNRIVTGYVPDRPDTQRVHK